MATPLAMADPVGFPFTPEAGTGWKITQSRTITHSDPAKNAGEAVIAATLKVLEETDEGYVMEWTTRTLTTQGRTLGANGPVPELLLGVPITYTTDAYGTPIALHDFETMFTNISKLFGGPLDAAAQERFDKTFGAMDEKTIANVFMQEASIIGQCLNFELDPDEPIRQQVQAPSPLGGPPILTNVEVKLEDAGDATRPARITLRQAFVPESATASIMASLERMAGKEAAQAQRKGGKLPALSNDSLITCHINTQTGEPVRIDSVLDGNVDGATKKDVRRFTFARQ